MFRVDGSSPLTPADSSGVNYTGTSAREMSAIEFMTSTDSRRSGRNRWDNFSDYAPIRLASFPLRRERDRFDISRRIDLN